MNNKHAKLDAIATFMLDHGYYSEAMAEMMDLILLQSARIHELEDEVEILGGVEARVWSALKKDKPLDREIIPDYILK